MASLGLLALSASLGAVGAAAVWFLMADTFAKPLFARTNVRGVDVPVAVGVVHVVVIVAATAVLIVAEAAGLLSFAAGPLLTTVLAVTGFGLLGLLDDLAGDGSSRGFSGHLRALAAGRLTTGAVKLFGGAAVAVIVASTVSEARVGRLLADAVLIALAANLANLFDRAPGRVTKVSLLAMIPIVVVAGADQRLMGPAIVVGAAVALLWPDLRERLMLGDTGANVLGSTLGLAVVLTASSSTRTIVLVVVAAANLISEKISFSSVIDRTPPLRAFDRLGRLSQD